MTVVSQLLLPLLALLTLLSLHWSPAAAQGRVDGALVEAEGLSGELDDYLTDLKDFYTKLSRPRFGKRSWQRGDSRWRTAASLDDVIHLLKAELERRRQH